MLWNENEEEFKNGTFFKEFKSFEEISADKQLSRLAKSIKR